MKVSKCCSAIAHKQEAGNYFCNHCISICETKNKTIIPVLLFLIGMLTVSLTTFAPPVVFKAVSRMDAVHQDTLVDTDIERSDSAILKELIKQGAYFPDVAIKQMHQECGAKINSDFALVNKNLFGIKCSCKYTNGSRHGHSAYKTYKDCIKCYVNFTNRYWVKYCKNYAEDSTYLTRLQNL